MSSYEQKMDAIVEDIAKKLLHIETLQTRNSDRLDFHDCAVWNLKRALLAAYQRGYDAGVEETLECNKRA